MRIRSIWLCLVCAAMVASSATLAAALDALPPDVRARGGLCVLIGGADDIAPAVELLGAGPWVIHWLDARPEAVESARRALRERGVYGRVSVERWDRDNLPYADNLLSMIVVRDERQAPGREELLRALAPQGAAFLPSGGGLARLDKPRPSEMGEWTHAWHDATGNLVSSDRALGVPNAFQWIAGPSFPMTSRKLHTGSLLSAGGRVFSLTQNVPENLGQDRQPDYLVARDAFSGIVLWSHRWGGHLSSGFQDPLHDAFVASADRLYGGHGDAVAVYDAATGDVVGTWPVDGTPTKLLLSGNVLVLQKRAGLTAFDAATGERKWHTEAERPWGTLVGEGRAVSLAGSRAEDGLWQHDLIAFDLDDGSEVWRRPVESRYGSRTTAHLRLHFVGEGVVCLIERYTLRFVSAEDGEYLWSHESEAMSRGDSFDYRQVGHFLVNGKVWVRQTRASGGRDAPETWLGLHPRTGEKLREVAATGPQGAIIAANKRSCQGLTATERFVLDSRLATMWDFEGGHRQGFKFVRGGCLLGLVPANGLAYAPPNACGCLQEQVRGNVAIVHSDDAGLRSASLGELERGPAYGQPLADDANGAGWPMYRRDAQRSGYQPEEVAPQLQARWETQLSGNTVDHADEWRLRFGPRYTAPVVSDGLVALAEPQTHQVIALDADTGAERWRFTAGGRVTTPPAFHRGLALFGAHDGYAYALRASDGELAWRRRVAPSDRRIMAYGQLESAWPVQGGVLIHQGVALAAAGRAVDADGGLVVRALEPATGEALWSQRVDEARWGVCDVLVADGQHAYLMDKRLDPRTGEVADLGFRYGSTNFRYPGGVRYLRGGNAGMMDWSWTGLPLALRKGISTWSWGVTQGQLVAFSGEEGYAFQVDGNGGGVVEARCAEDHSVKWAYELPAAPGIESMLANEEAVFVVGQAEAMAASANAVFLGGPSDVNAPDGPGFLRAISVNGGREAANVSLPSAPVYDGLAVADGSVFAVLRDGTVVRFGGE